MRAEVTETDEGETQVEFCVGEYKLRWTLPDDGEFSEIWLVNKDDEGMTMTEGEMEQMLYLHFKANF